MVSAWPNYRRNRIDQVLLSFRTGSVDARLIAGHIHDGPKLIAAFDRLTLCHDQTMTQFTVPGSPIVYQKICIALQFEFGPGERWIEFQSVGADFFMCTRAEDAP